jgi:hypothetical protein
MPALERQHAGWDLVATLNEFKTQQQFSQPASGVARGQELKARS